MDAAAGQGNSWRVGGRERGPRRGKLNSHEEIARAHGLEEGLAAALRILEDLAEVMLERERAAPPGRKANHARRTRIKAYQVAAKRVQTRLGRQRAVLARLDAGQERPGDDEALRAAVADLAL